MLKQATPINGWHLLDLAPFGPEAGGAVGFASVVTDQIRSCINMIDIGEKWRPASDYESYQRF